MIRAVFVLGVQRGQPLQRVHRVGLRRGDLSDGVPGQRAVPVQQPPRPVGLVVPDRGVGVVVRNVPPRDVRVHLGVLEHGQPLDPTAGHGQVIPVGVLVDVDGQRADAVLLLQRDHAGVVGRVVLQRAGAQLVPGDDAGQHVVGLGVGQEVAQHGGVVVGRVRPGDQRARVVGPDPAIDRGPVRLELRHLRVKLTVRRVQVVPDVVRLVERHEHVVAGVRAAGHGGDDRVHRGQVAGDADVLVGPVGVVVLHVVEQVLAAGRDELLGDLVGVPGGVLGGVGRPCAIVRTCSGSIRSAPGTPFSLSPYSAPLAPWNTGPVLSARLTVMVAAAEAGAAGGSASPVSANSAPAKPARMVCCRMPVTRPRPGRRWPAWRPRSPRRSRSCR